MSITLKKVGKAYNALTVLTDVSIALNPGERIALVGENGAGKTTILKLCAGIEEPTSGRIARENYTVALYVPQEFPLLEYDGMTGMDYVYMEGNESVMRGVKKLLAEFEIEESILEKELAVLSGGQQRILNICTAFAKRPQYLLIDEPENHLDIFARQVLIDLMQNYRGCVVFVSHDQELINAVTNRIVEVVNGTVQSYTGTYEFYLEHKARIEAGKANAWRHHEKEVDRLDRLIKRMREWVKLNPDLGAQLRARKTQLRHLEENAPVKPRVQKVMNIRMGEVDVHHSKRMLTSKALSIRLGDKLLIRDTDVSLFFGEKVALIGRNGTGKSTFLKAALEYVPISGGELKLGVDIKVGYFSQEALTTLDPDQTALDAVSAVSHASEHQNRSMLARYLIGADSCTRSVSTLSGGQKTRLRFCLLFAANNDLLIMDEPTNHLDPLSWEILAESLKEYRGTLLMVSHDRIFIDQVAEKLWVVRNGKIAEFFGSLSEYLTKSS